MTRGRRDPSALPGKIRIIGGRWRGSRIPLATGADVRPSSDRVRETLFNWLQPRLAGARCADLFAGSGVLGFEAVSRGAASAELIEIDAAVAACLAATRERLGAENVVVHHADAFAWLQHEPTPYDIVFVDPPFRDGLVARTLAALTGGWLSATAVVYVERARADADEYAGWRILRQGRTRMVDYALVRYPG